MVNVDKFCQFTTRRKWLSIEGQGMDLELEDHLA